MPLQKWQHNVIICTIVVLLLYLVGTIAPYTNGSFLLYPPPDTIKYACHLIDITVLHREAQIVDPRGTLTINETLLVRRVICNSTYTRTLSRHLNYTTTHIGITEEWLLAEVARRRATYKDTWFLWDYRDYPGQFDEYNMHSKPLARDSHSLYYSWRFMIGPFFFVIGALVLGTIGLMCYNLVIARRKSITRGTVGDDDDDDSGDDDDVSLRSEEDPTELAQSIRRHYYYYVTPLLVRWGIV